MKGNFNKAKYDRTIWYAFVDQNKFIKLCNNKIDIVDTQNGNWCSTTPIPDTKTDTKTDKESKPKKAGHSPLASNDAHASSHFSILEELVNMLLVSIISLRPSFKVSGYNLHKWHLAMDLMIRRDSREIEEMKQVLEWLPSNEFWNANILSASKFRKQYDKLCIEMEKAKNDESKYKIFAFKAKKHCNLNNLNVSNLGVYDKYSKFELSYKMPYEDFCRCLAKQYSLTEYEGDM